MIRYCTHWSFCIHLCLNCSGKLVNPLLELTSLIKIPEQILTYTFTFLLHPRTPRPRQLQSLTKLKRDCSETEIMCGFEGLFDLDYLDWRDQMQVVYCQNDWLSARPKPVSPHPHFVALFTRYIYRIPKSQPWLSLHDGLLLVHAHYDFLKYKKSILALGL